MAPPAAQTGQQTPSPQTAGDADATNAANAGKQALPIQGRFSNYIAPYLRLILPLLTARYLVEGVERLNPLNMLKKGQPAQQAYWQKNFFALGWGALATAVTGYYTRKTYQDIKTVFAEAAGYELNKAPNEITFNDMRQSTNPLLKTTMKALTRRTAMRFAADATLFLPWHVLSHPTEPGTKIRDADAYQANSRMGTGVIASYLFMDAFTRKESLFELLQNLVDDKIQHNTNNPYDIIQTSDISSMLLIYRRGQDKSYQPPAPATQAAHDNQRVAAFIADRMNQTYGNTPREENVDLTVGKVLFLLGNGLMDKFPENMAYVELAGKGKGVEEVKQVAAAIAKGADPIATFAEHGVVLDAQGNARTVTMEQQPQPEQAPMRFTDRVQQPQSHIPETARTPQDFAAQTGSGPALGH